MATETNDERVAQVKREHAARIEKLKKEGAERVAAVYQRHRDSCGTWDLKQQLKREEDRVRRQNDDALELAYKRTSRDFRKHLKLPMQVADARHKLADLVETHALYADEPRVVCLRNWFYDDVCNPAGIEVREDAAPQLRNGSANRQLRRVTIAPIQSLETAAVAAHEAGHVLSDTNPDAPSTPGEFGIGRICVDDEIRAWSWVLARIPVWEEAMHQRMTECLASYRPRATGDEATQIDVLCGDVTYKERGCAS